MPTQESSATPPQRPSRWLAACEVGFIVLLFFLFAGSPPPDVGESHYLAKARHHWQPEWCAGDLFLESHDAHLAFYWTLGWLANIAPLPAAAWIGRLITWLLLAWSWQRLSWAIVPTPLVSLLSAGWLLLLLRNFHLAGEWVVGGVEAKGPAYVLVFLALEAIAKGRWSAGLLLCGAAGAFHVLVGGWTAIAIGFAWLIAGRDRPRLVSLVPAAAGALALALPGLIPAIVLNRGVPPEVSREAARIYVFERLPHHLVYHLFPAWNVTRFQGLVVLWAVLWWLLRKHAALGRIQRVVAGALAICLAGIVLDQALVARADHLQQPAEDYERTAAPLLRYYWFRMSDSLLPLGAALAIAAGLADLKWRRPAAATWLTVVCVLLPAVNLIDVCYWRSRQRLPAAILQPRPTPDSWPRSWLSADEHPYQGGVTAQAWYRDWRAACRWIAENTAADALFITPREQQTFKWYAGRAEVANWKDVPQDAAGLIEWQRRLTEIYPRDREHHRHDLAAFDDAALAALARKFGADYIVIDLTRAERPIGLPRIYPTYREENTSFAVYRVPPLATTNRRNSIILTPQASSLPP